MKNKINEQKKVTRKLDLRTAKKMAAFIEIAILSLIIISFPQIAFAETGAELVTSSFSSLMDIITAFVSSIGAIVLMWAFFEMGIAVQSQEGTMQAMSFKRIGGGLVMVLAPQLISAFIK